MEFGSVIANDHFDLKQIAKSGQCFRMKEVLPNVYRIISRDRCLYATQIDSNHIGFSEFDSFWTEYFDILMNDGKNDDYAKVESLILSSKDDYLKSAFEYGKGIRILNQDLWETIVCFIVSQNNNIKRITNSIDNICLKAGLSVSNLEDSDIAYRIPRFGEINGDFFLKKELGLGYRDVFLQELYNSSWDVEGWLNDLKTMTYDEAYKELIKIKGIGPKVANCICLFGLHHIEAFPIDTHIKQILELHYPYGFDFKRYEGVAGIVQQYMFFYKISK